MTDTEAKCPFDHTGSGAPTGAANPSDVPLPEGQSAEPRTDDRLPNPTEGSANQVWWPQRLNLKLLAQNPRERDPEDPDFDYRKAFESLDLDAVKRDIAKVLTDSKPWWPADFGNYGPNIIRVAWHSAGTYRVFDGRGGSGHGQQRFAPLNSWPDNANTDKGRRVLWPVKQKYGKSLSWGDLMVLAGNVALETMGFTTFGYGGGRVDEWEPDESVYWGSETRWLGSDQRFHGTNTTTRDLDKPFASTHIGLIYVNPEGPEGVPDPALAAHDIRETFARMGMNDEETVALIAGGHTFGKTHGAAADDTYQGPEPEAAPLEQQGLGWKGSYGTGTGDDAIVSGIEVTWTYHPTRWDNEFFHILFGYEWECVTGQGGHYHWRPKDNGGQDMVPFAHSAGRREPRMLTTDIALRVDPAYEKIARRFKDDQEAFSDAFARAWFKLTHRDMGPKSRYLGPEVPAEDLIWQDPLPTRDDELIDADDVSALGEKIIASGLSVSALVRTTWAAISSFRGSDKRGGANGGRLRLEPERHWEVNNPDELGAVLDVLERIRTDFNREAEATGSGTRVSLADLIVLGGDVAVQKAAVAAGVNIGVPFTPGRVDASQDQTDPQSFGYLEPEADGFRNYLAAGEHRVTSEHLLIDRANLLTLTVPELVVLVGGLRVLGANWDGSDLGVLTDRPGWLTNDFFVNLLDMGVSWKPAEGGSERAEVERGEAETYVATDDATGTERWRGSRVDLVFGANAELRAVAEVYASADAGEKFVRDFVAAWVRLTNADRFDLR